MMKIKWFQKYFWKQSIGTKNEFEKSINYKITDSETVSMFCWQHGTVKPLCKAYKSEE